MTLDTLEISYIATNILYKFDYNDISHQSFAKIIQVFAWILKYLLQLRNDSSLEASIKIERQPRNKCLN